jgi:hypothetical protein
MAGWLNQSHFEFMTKGLSEINAVKRAGEYETADAFLVVETYPLLVGFDAGLMAPPPVRRMFFGKRVWRPRSTLSD